MPFTKSLRAKVLVSALIPITLALVVVAVIALFAYERAARDVVLQRDAELASVSAARLAEGLSRLKLLLQTIADDDDVQSLEAARMKRALEREQDQLLVFNAGVVIYDDQEMAVWSDPFAFRRRGMRFPDPSVFDKVLTTLRPSFSHVFRDEISGEDVVLLTVPIVARGPEFKGAVAGMSTLNSLLQNATYSEVLEITAGSERFAYLVDGNGKVIFHSDRSRLGTDLSAIVPVKRVKEGNTSAVIAVIAVIAEGPTGETVISGYAPVPDTDWAVITQERWQSVVGPIRGFSRLLLGLLVLGGVLSAVLVFFAIGRVLKPVKELTQGAQRIAGGDFDYSIVANSGDEIEELAQQFTMMADALKESYAGLEQTVEARTEELRQAEEKYRSIVENSVEGIFQTSIDGRFLSANPSLAQIYGYQSSEDLLDSLTDIQRQLYVEPGRRGEFIRLMEQHGAVTGFESQVYRKDSSVIWISESTRAVRGESGEIQYYEGSVEDITERKAAQEALRESEERYRELVETAPDVIYTISPQGTITSLNPSFESITGWSRSEWHGKRFTDLIHPDDLAPATEQFQRVLQGEVPPRFERRVLTKSGEYLTGEFLTSPQWQNGKVIGVFGIGRDITERKQAQEALRESEERYRDLVDTAQDIIYTVSIDGTISSLNPAFETISGWSRSEWLGRDADDLIHPDDLDPAGDLVERIWQGFRPPETQRFERRLLTKSGEYLNCEFLTTPQMRDGTLIGLVGIGRDITERKRSEEALRESEERYRDLVDTAQDIIYTLSIDGTITSLNPAFETITGWSRSEWLGRPSDDLIHPDDLDPARNLRDLVQRIRPGDQSPYIERSEMRLLTKSGEYLSCEFLATTQTRDGTLIGLVGIGRDITERKRAEEELRQSEERFRDLVEYAADPIFVMGPGGRLVDVNRRACDVLGYEREELLTLTYSSVFPSLEQSAVDEMFETLESGGDSITLDGFALRKDESSIDVEMH